MSDQPAVPPGTPTPPGAAPGAPQAPLPAEAPAPAPAEAPAPLAEAPTAPAPADAPADAPTAPAPADAPTVAIETGPVAGGSAAAAGGSAAGGATAPAGGVGATPPTTPVSGATTTGGGGGGNRTVLIVSAVILVAVILAAAFVVSQNGQPAASEAPGATAAATAPAEVPAEATPERTAEATPEPTAAPTATPNACAPENLATLTAGTMTVGTDNPAYPPYFQPRQGGNSPPWEASEFTGDPTTGEGFESAVAYAIAAALGYPKEQVAWVVVPFLNSFAPGPKTFDYYIGQVSYKPERAQGADLTDGYYDVRQSVVALEGSPLAKATTVTELAAYKFGAQVGTTSYDTIVNTIKPTQDPSVFDTNDAAIEALKNGQIDGIVVDLPTADFITNVQVENAVAVGKFESTGEHFSLVLAKDSPLTACANEAIAKLTADGTLAGLSTKWLPFQEGVPAFAP